MSDHEPGNITASVKDAYTKRQKGYQVVKWKIEFECF